MIIISLSQDLEGNPNLVVIDCINHLVIFSCQPTGKMPTLAKASHHLSKAFQHVYGSLVEKKFHSYGACESMIISCLREETCCI